MGQKEARIAEEGNRLQVSIEAFMPSKEAGMLGAKCLRNMMEWGKSMGSESRAKREEMGKELPYTSKSA